MRIQRLFILLVLLGLISGCYFGITGRVIDAETNLPIEGAVVLVEWTKTKGIGLTYTESDKVAEVLSDKDGKFGLPGCYNPFANPPALAIYKKGYVTWSNRWIFPGWKKRTEFNWESGKIYKLDKFKDTFSYIDHYGFTTSAINSTIGGPNDKRLFFQIFSEAEEE